MSEGERILVVDDSAEMREYLGHVLGEHYQVEAVADGEAALSVARKTLPDLIVADVIMPELDGLGLLRALRADASTRAVPIILISARAEDEARIEGLEAGANDYLTKPFSARELLARVAARLEAGRHEQETLRASEARFRTIFEQAGVSIALVAPSGWIMRSNAALRRLLGYSDSELRAAPYVTFVHPDEEAIESSAFAELMAGRLQVYEREIRCVRKDGQTLWGSLSVSAVRSANGEPQFGVWILQDITSRKAAEAESRRQGEQLHLLREIDGAALTGKSLEEIARVAVERLCELGACERASVLIYDADAGKAHVLAICLNEAPDPMPERTIPLDMVRIPTEHRQGRPHIVGDMQAPPHRDEPLGSALAAAGIRSHLSLPLMSEGALIGSLNLSSRAPHAFSHVTIETVEPVALSLAAALKSARQRDQIQAGREALQNLTRRLVEASENERRAVARELHDEAGQMLTSLKLSLGMLQREPECPAPVAARLAELTQFTDNVMEGLHRLSVNLRPSSLDSYGLIPAIEQYAASFQSETGLEVAFLAEGLGTVRLSADLEMTLYRVVQEALTNIARHAQATHVSVILERRGSQVQVIVEDDGVGFDVDEALRRGRLGLLGMRERVEMFGGKLTIESSAACGTTIYAEVPWMPVTGSAGTAEVSPMHAEAATFAPDGESISAMAELARAVSLGEALNDIHYDISSLQAPGAILQQALDKAVQAMGCDAGLVIAREGTAWRVEHVHRMPQSLIDRPFALKDAPYVEYAASSRQVLVVSDSAHDPRFDPQWGGQLGARAFVIVPLVIHGEVVGTLSLHEHARIRHFAPAEIRFAQRLGQSLSLMLENARLHQAEELRAQNDELLALSETLEREREQLRRALDRLAESEERYRLLFDTMTEGFGLWQVVKDDQGRPTDFRLMDLNHAGERLTGLWHQEVVGQPVSDLVPDLAPQWVAAMGRVAATGEAMQVEGYSQEYGRWFEATIYDPGEDRLATVFVDSTERKQAELALKEAIAELQDTQDELELSNRIARTFLLYPGEEMFGKVLEVVLAATESQYGIFAYLDEDGSIVAPSMTREVWKDCQMPEKSIRFSREMWAGMRGQVLHEKRSRYSNAPSRVPDGHVQVRRVLVVPILYQGEPVGHFEVANKATDYGEADRERLEQIAGIVAPVLHARLRSEFQERKRQAAEAGLRRLTVELEQRVVERTAALQASREQLAEREVALQALSRRLVEIQEQERREVADRLYNKTGQVLAALRVQLGLLEQELGDAWPRHQAEADAASRARSTGERLIEMSRMTDQLLADLYHMAVHLRPASLDQLGLVSAIEQSLADFGREHGLHVQFEALRLEGLRISDAAETAVYRIVEEALANVAQHAAAGAVGIIMSRVEDRLVVVVEDDGVGFDATAAEQAGGIGLLAMRERAKSLGGSLAIESRPGSGTSVIVEVPIC